MLEAQKKFALAHEAPNLKTRPQTTKHGRTSQAARSLVAGGVAGMCAKTAVAPLDRIKILLQAQSSHYKHDGVFSGLRNIVRNESFVGLYKGNGAQLVRIFPYSGIQFFSFDVYKNHVFGPLLGSLPGEMNHLQKILAGGAAGGTAVILTYPLDLVRARLTYQVLPQASGQSRSAIIYTIVHAFKNEGGTRALYRGISATLIAMIPYSALNFYAFDTSKQVALKKRPDLFGKTDPKTGELTLHTYARLGFGALSGSIAQTLGYPLDVARRRMQLGMLSPDTARFSENVFKTIKLIYRENGIAKGLYRGLSINYLRAAPMVAVQFTTYESMKQLLGLSTGSF